MRADDIGVAILVACLSYAIGTAAGQALSTPGNVQKACEIGVAMRQLATGTGSVEVCRRAASVMTTNNHRSQSR